VKEIGLAYVSSRVDANLWRMADLVDGRRPAPLKTIASSRDDFDGAFSSDGTESHSPPIDLGITNLTCNAMARTKRSSLLRASVSLARWSPDGRAMLSTLGSKGTVTSLLSMPMAAHPPPHH